MTIDNEEHNPQPSLHSIADIETTIEADAAAVVVEEKAQAAHGDVPLKASVPSPSVAGSAVSVGAQRRREELLKVQCTHKEQHEQEEQELREQEEKELEMAEIESQRGGIPLTEGALFALNATSPEQVQARLRDLKREREALLGMAQSFVANDPPALGPARMIPPHRCPTVIRSPKIEEKRDFQRYSAAQGLHFRVAEPFSKVKLPPPKPWKGSFVQSERDGWIQSAEGYFVGIGIFPKDRIDKILAPAAYHIVQSTMSDALSSSGFGISVQQWFDSQNLTMPWETTTHLVTAMREFWVDDTAVERAVIAFRAARQGYLRAHEFGASVQALAVACHGRIFTEEDKKEVFLLGLKQGVKEYVELVV
jgi:hypothetical protein